MSAFFDLTFDTFVVYALRELDSEPDEDSPSVVLPALFAGDRDLLLADQAPYITMLDYDGIEDEIDRIVADYMLSVDERLAFEQLREFVRGSFDEGYRWFGYQVEPEDMAGDGTARRKGLEASE